MGARYAQGNGHDHDDASAAGGGGGGRGGKGGRNSSAGTLVHMDTVREAMEKVIPRILLPLNPSFYSNSYSLTLSSY